MMKRLMPLALTFSSLGCFSFPPPRPADGVVIVDGTEQASEYLHSSCKFRGAQFFASAIDATFHAKALGANVVLPLGGARYELYSKTSSTVANLTMTTTQESWSATTGAVIFDCAEAPVAKAENR